MELVLARLARQPRQPVVARVQDAVADGALLHPLKLLVKVALPRTDRLCDCPILVAHKRRQRQQPFPAFDLADAQASSALNLHVPQRVTARKPYHKINPCFFLLVCSNDLIRRPVYTH